MRLDERVKRAVTSLRHGRLRRSGNGTSGNERQVSLAIIMAAWKVRTNEVLAGYTVY
jgi:hypothetical protein